MTRHNLIAAVLLSDLRDHANANEAPCPECIKRAKRVSKFFVMLKEMLDD